MNKVKVLLLFFVFTLFNQTVFAADANDKGLQQGDLSFSIGAGKNILFHQQFETTAPFLLSVNVDYAIFNAFELGLTYTPIFFANKSNVDFNNASALKNQNNGGIQVGGLSLKYNIYNDYGVVAYLAGSTTYGVLDKKSYKDGQLYEIDGSGINYGLGLGVRYYLGDEYGDVYPWYFDMGVYINRLNQKVSNFRLDGEVQAKTDSNWGDLHYNGLDVVIKFGYRFRLKK